MGRVTKAMLLTVEFYHCYRPHSKLYLIFFIPISFHLQTKLLEIAFVGCDAIHQILLR